jgi:hypothetical protein
VIAALLIVLTSGSAHGWEDDVHFLLTWWLATQAGFDRTAAFDIADGNAKRDVGAVQPATAIMPHALILGDVGASQEVRDKHFPANVSLPNPPMRRVVEPGGKAAREALNVALGRPSDEVALERLGQALHTLQDSWSHQGVPDTPIRPGSSIRPELSWSHPEARGGWFRHDADLTSLYRQDATETARATYDALVEFLNRHPSYPKGKQIPWTTIQPLVRQFVEARTKSEKSAWLKRVASPAIYGGESYIKALSIPGSNSFKGELATIVLQESAKATPLTAPIYIAKRAAEFINLWFRQQEVEKAARYINWDQVGKQQPKLVKQQVVDWGRRFMTMMLAQDHGQMNALGHADPEAAGYASIPLDVTRGGTTTTASLLKVGFQAGAPAKAVTVPASEVTVPSDPVLVSVPKETFGVPGWAIVLRINYAPTDRIIVVFDDSQNAQVVRMFSLVAH